jgi:predicted flap endonuclease-1-like 5' DNA nuclease
MTIAQDLWLRGKAAQASVIHLAAYNTAIAGTATIQAWKLGLNAPMGFWQAIGRAGGVRTAKRATPRPAQASAGAAAKADPKPSASAAAAAPPKVDATPAAKAEKADTGPAAKATAPEKAPVPAAKAPAAAASAAKATASTAPAMASAPAEASPPKPAAAPKPSAKAPATAAPAPKPKAAARTKSAPKEPVDPATAPVATGPSPHLLDAPRGGKADDLTQLAGVGQKLAAALNEFGIYHFDQIATLDAKGIDWLNDQQPGFKMIAARYKVVDQAKARLKT